MTGLGRDAEFWLGPTWLGEFAFQGYVECPTEGKTHRQRSGSAGNFRASVFRVPEFATPRNGRSRAPATLLRSKNLSWCSPRGRPMKGARKKPAAANLRSWRVIIMRSKGEYLGSVEAPDRERAEAVAIKQFDLEVVP